MIWLIWQVAEWSGKDIALISRRYDEDDEHATIDCSELFVYDDVQCKHHGGCAGSLVYHGTRNLKGILESGYVMAGPRQKNKADGIHYTIPMTWRCWSYTIPILVGIQWFYVVVECKAHCGKKVEKWFYTHRECYKRLELKKLIFKPIKADIKPMLTLRDDEVSTDDEVSSDSESNSDDSWDLDYEQNARYQALIGPAKRRRLL